MSGPSGITKLAHRQLRTLTWPSIPPGVGTSNDLSIVEDDLEHCGAPCRHHPRSDKYPTIGEGRHIPNLQKFAEDLTDGLKAVFPNRQAIYNRVHALLISWGQNDDLGTETEVDELKRLFEETYNFTVEKYVIPAELSEDQLEEKCMEVRRDHTGARDLLIVYYGGHGLLKGNKSIWHAWKNKPSTATTQRETSPELDWTEAHRSLMKARGDVLFILDCCYATFTTKIEPRGGTKELLAATSFKQTATGVHENSFTMAFIRELKGINKLPYTASMIHERLFNHYTNYKIAVPQYVGLYRTVYAQSIVLAPQKAGDPFDREVTTKGILVQQPKFMTDCRILISIALDNPYQPPDFTEWNEWFRKAAPRNIKDVEFSIEKYIRPEGAWESTSTLYLFSMPAALWNSIPSNPAYKMLAIIKSENLLKPRYVSQGVQVEIESPAVGVALSSIAPSTGGSVEEGPEITKPSKLKVHAGRPGSSKARGKGHSERAPQISPQTGSAVGKYGTIFYGSQIGEGGPVPEEAYTASPLQLILQDLLNLGQFVRFLPHILRFLMPMASSSGPFSERYPSVANIECSFIHVVLLVLQVLFVFSIPFAIFLPLPVVVTGLAGFWGINNGLCYFLNGPRKRFSSDPKYAEGRAHEQWVFINGIGAGSDWLQSNLDRLALTFGRPVMGIHNQTNGIIFDIFQCVIQRCFNYPTADTRDCYAILRELLYNQYITSVVLILHSQGGIAGSMVLDRLHAEIREDLFAKLEVYTFGNAANHFNNPYCSLRGHVGPSLATLSLDPDPAAQLAGMELITGKAIRHIEHYANTSDPLARLGVLNDPVGVLSNTISAKNRTNFTGSIFERGEIGGQLFCHDYLDKMFPLKRCAEGAGIGGSGFVGALEEENEFMEATLGRIEEVAGRESWEMSYFGVHGELLEAPTEGKYTASNIGLSFLAWEWQSNVEEVSKSSIERARISLSGAPPGRVFDFKVKDLSRLWLYVNGKNPKKTLVDLRNAKMSEI